MPRPRVARHFVDQLLSNTDLLNQQIAALHGNLRQHGKRDVVARQLRTIPGAGAFGALLLHAEIGPIALRERARVGGVCRLTPSTRSSGGKKSHGQVRRGNPSLRWIPVEILQTLRQAPGPAGDRYRKVLRAKGKSTATVAAAHRLCKQLYRMLTEESRSEEWLRHHDHLEVRPVQQLESAS